MNTIIVDDSQMAINVLKAKLKRFPDIQVVGTANNGTDGLALWVAHKPELLFLDVELPDMSGMELLDIVNAQAENNCHIIVYTAYDKYMLSSFRKQVFDFLLKPIEDKNLDTIIKLVYADKIKNPLINSFLQKNNEKKLLFYINSVDFRFVKIRDIGLFQYNHDARVWEIILADREEPLRLRRNTTNSMLLDIDADFIQVNQKYIVNMNYVIEVNDNICHFYPPFDRIEYVNVGSFFRKKLVNRFNVL